MPRTARNQEFDVPSSGQIIAERSNVLRRIVEPDVNLALWQRPTQESIVRELSKLQASDLRDVRRPTSLRSFDDDVVALLAEQNLDPFVLVSFRSDMHQLAEMFFSINDSPEAEFRLVTTDRDNCRRFHVDRRRLRLLCTYQGPGTEWLTEEQVDRVALAGCLPNSAVVRFGQPSRFARFWVGIMKGDPENEGWGLVHRSPPIEGSGQVRVLFCLDS
ncbi:MAG: DUF1826 domain-containing protein [Halioglobus sp.]